MATTLLAIYNEALLLNGQQELASTTEASTECIYCATFYAPARKQVLKAFDWPFARRFANLTFLVASIALAESLRTHMNAHAADAAEHTNGADTTNFPLTSPTATNLATLITLINEIMADYTAHDADAKLPVSWDFHKAAYAGSKLNSTIAPVTYADCATRLNDIKAKYNIHDKNAVAHNSGSSDQEATADVPTSVEWDYLYDKPTSCLQIRSIEPEDSVANESNKVKYAVVGSYIYTNESNAWCKYTLDADTPAEFDDLFASALAHRIAVYISMPIHRDKNYTQMMYQMYKTVLSEAQTANANEQHDVPVVGQTFITARR